MAAERAITGLTNYVTSEGKALVGGLLCPYMSNCVLSQ